MAKIKDIMDVEKMLLELNEKDKSELSFDSQYKLKKYLEEIGDITSFFFEIQSDFYKRNGNKEELEKYHNKLMEENIDYDLSNAINLLKKC